MRSIRDFLLVVEDKPSNKWAIGSILGDMGISIKTIIINSFRKRGGFRGRIAGSTAS